MHSQIGPHTLYVEKHGRMHATFIKGSAQHCYDAATNMALHTQAGRDARKITGWKVVRDR